MSVRELGQAIAAAGTILGIVPVLIGVVRRKARPAEFGPLWLWLLVGAVFNIGMAWTGYHNRENTMLAQVGYLVHGVIGLFSIRRLVESYRLRLAILAGSCLYPLFWLWRASAGELGSQFSTTIGPVLWVGLTLAAAALIGDRLRSVVTPPLRDPAVLAGLAVIVSYAPGAALEPVSLQLFQQAPDLTRWLFVARGVLLIIGYLLFTLVMLWTIPPRSSPGSSSSVG